MPEQNQPIPVSPDLRRTVLELSVRNHPGAMSHITGLFARRAFNLESILCVPDAEAGGATSTMLLGVVDDPLLPQVEQQLRRLHDVLAVRRRAELASLFDTWLGQTRAIESNAP